jgi:zinc/manganese transport system substrate-binding protein
MKQIPILVLVFLLPIPAQALNVFVCEPEWGSLVQELAGDTAEITVATTAFQDPHSLQARPSLIAAIRSADLVVCTGADLEIGWLPLLLRRAGNSNIQLGSPGHFLAADFVRKLEIPQVVDRSQGDVHPQGNPHVHLDPRNFRRISNALSKRLAELDPANFARYESLLENFQTRWEDAVSVWEDEAADLAGLRLASNHRSFSYLVEWLDMEVVATLEPKPGIPASGAQLAKLLEQLAPNPPAAIIRTPYANEKASMWLSERIDTPELILPYTIGGTDTVIDLFTLFDESIRMLKEHSK